MSENREEVPAVQPGVVSHISVARLPLTELARDPESEEQLRRIVPETASPRVQVAAFDASL